MSLLGFLRSNRMQNFNLVVGGVCRQWFLNFSKCSNYWRIPVQLALFYILTPAALGNAYKNCQYLGLLRRYTKKVPARDYRLTTQYVLQFHITSHNLEKLAVPYPTCVNVLGTGLFIRKLRWWPHGWFSPGKLPFAVIH